MAGNGVAVIGVDVGGTSLKAELVDAAGAVLAARRVPTRSGEQDVLDAIAELVRELESELASGPGPAPHAGAVGLAIPGVVDLARGVALHSVNLGWREVPVRDEISRRTGLPVTVVHDVAAAGLAERAVGAGHGEDDVLVVVIGTGIAAVAFSAGCQVRGATGRAGELGHVVIRPDGPRCRCGRSGCLETLASARAIADSYARRTGTNVDGAAQVVALLETDPDARAVWAEAVGYLAEGLLAACALLDPARVVIGGGLAEADETLLGPLRAELAARATWQSVPTVVRAGLGSRGGVVGAALAARAMVGGRQ